MIKHRFILRDITDFKVFAAIPVESSLLTWKKWVRPPDWEGIRRCVAAGRATERGIVQGFTDFIERLSVGRAEIKSRWGGGQGSLIQADCDNQIAWARPQLEKLYGSLGLLDEWEDALTFPESEVPPNIDDLFGKTAEAISTHFGAYMDPHGAFSKLIEKYKGYYKTVNSVPTHARNSRSAFSLAFHRDMIARIEALIKGADARLATATMARELLSSDPLPDTPCPPGLPFAAYTVEFGGTVVNVVGGCAWVAARPPVAQEVVERTAEVLGKETLDKLARGVVDDRAERVATALTNAAFAPTSEEKRVVEIVSQMLTERGLNPKADTRIPVREVDPKHAHQTREAERKSTISVRTIKFEITPPRYLREAVEKIERDQLEAGYVPRKAHWVIGHWRNQPYGEKRAQRKQIWIAPHIRGLGEASSVVARVAAPRPEAPS